MTRLVSSNTTDYVPRSADDPSFGNSVSPGTSDHGIPLVEGRQLSNRDSSGSARVAILNRAAARQYFGGLSRSTVGAIFRLDREVLAPIEVVGVVGTAGRRSKRSIRANGVPPLDQDPRPMSLRRCEPRATSPGRRRPA